MQTDLGALSGGIGGNGTTAFKCSFCASVVTYSDRLVAIAQSKTHSFTNPAGVRCEFYTFASCPGAIPIGNPTQEHTWFPGYQWSLALCRNCGNHLGWLYESVSRTRKPGGFWGILRYHILTE
jgi:cereblon